MVNVRRIDPPPASPWQRHKRLDELQPRSVKKTTSGPTMAGRELVKPMKVLTALPVFNEERHIEPVLREVRRYAGDILVVDDGSADNTPAILARQSALHVVTHESNAGYGAALRTAFLFAQEHEYDVLVTIDCDGQHEPRLIPRLVAALFPKNASPYDIVSGSRYLQRFPGESVPPEDRRRINSEITRLLNGQFGLHLTDAFCGFKAYRTHALKQLDITELGYAMPLQVWVQAAAAGMRIVEFPVPLVYLEEERSFGGSLDDARRRRAYYLEVLRRESEREGRSEDVCPSSEGACRPASCT